MKPRDVDERIEADERKRAPLTWREWSEAAGYSSRASMSASHLRAARKAWREGVSPAEYRRRVNRGEL